MSNEFKPKQSLSHEMFSSYALKTNENNELDADLGTSYEVFRNKTTAVEVIVKEVPKKHVKGKENTSFLDYKVKNLHEDVDRLKSELNKANMYLERMKKGFGTVISEMKKQLDIANKREFDAHAKNLAIQLENEKLRTLLASKTSLVTKFKNELHHMNRALKFVMKSICYAPKIPDNVSYNTEPEYNEFENRLKKGIKTNVANVFYGNGTVDSTISKDTKNSFDQ